MKNNSKNSSFLGSIAGRLLSLFGDVSTKPTIEDLQKMEFTSSTQHLGLRFTEKIRDIFRFKWLKKS